MSEPVLLAWAQIVLTFALANYLSRDPLRDETQSRWHVWVVMRSLVAFAIIWYFSASLPLSAVVLAASIALPFGRRAISPRFSAELEIVSAVSVAATLFLLANAKGARVENALFTVSVSNQKIASGCLVVALLLFTVHGGTYIVRGLLNKSGAIPTMKSDSSGESSVDLKEFNRGRLIGALERVLLFAVVIAGSYEALGFIVAAKGLVRSREFEVNRDMTEYFLIGSLASVLIALATGSAARYILQTYWR